MLDARGDVLYVGKARALQQPGDQLHPGRAAAEAAAADGLADPVDADRHHQYRGRGAAARGAADQALPAALQRPAARRQKLPLHPAARGSRFPARPASIAARGALKGQYYGPFASAGSVTQHAQRAAETVPAAELHRQLLRQPHAALPALPDPALLGALRRPDRRGRLCRAGRRRQGLPRRQVDQGPAEARSG